MSMQEEEEQDDARPPTEQPVEQATAGTVEDDSTPSKPERIRSIKQLRDTMSMLTHYVWTKQLRPGEHMWSIPVDKQRDFDCILHDAISELEYWRWFNGQSPSVGEAPLDATVPTVSDAEIQK